MEFTPAQQLVIADVGERLRQAVEELYRPPPPAASDHDILLAYAWMRFGSQVQDPERDISVSNEHWVQGCLCGDAAIRLHTPLEYVTIQFSRPLPPGETEETHE